MVCVCVCVCVCVYAYVWLCVCVCVCVCQVDQYISQHPATVLAALHFRRVADKVCVGHVRAAT